jgi:SAM-dependent methyltransferase
MSHAAGVSEEERFMNRLNKKPLRFLWRVSRNLLCLVPATRRILFPQNRLAACFGRGDAEYAWRVFHRHFNMLRDAGFSSAERILEVGPGRNLGTALLWWAYCGIRSDTPVEIVCWDVFKNASPEVGDFWANLARELLRCAACGGLQESEINQVQAQLREVVEGRLQPPITYRVEPLQELEGVMAVNRAQFDLIYSQAAIEHVWDVAKLWRSLIGITRSSGWHSHQIDLADHGRRESNYIEMLEWSPWAYWLTMRFIPGAVNRWRACHHLEFIAAYGLRVVHASREIQKGLPIPRQCIAQVFRTLPETELRSTALDIVAIKMR